MTAHTATAVRPRARTSATGSRRRSHDASPRSFSASIPTREAVARRGRGHERGACAPRLHAVRGRDAAGGVGDVERPSAAGVVSRLETAAAVLAHCRALIDAAGPACVAVKPQLACFERLGAPGWLALEHVVRARPRRGPARARRRQARRRPRHRGGLRAGARRQHAVAVRGGRRPRRRRLHRQPAARPRRARAAGRRPRAAGAGVFVLVRTSNPGAADILDVELPTGERAVGAAGAARRRAGRARRRPGSATSAPSPARPSPSTSRGCAS